MNKTLINCETCNKQIKKESNRSWNTYQLKKYCSKQCSNIGRTNHIKKICVCCNIEFDIYPSHEVKTNSNGDSYERKYCSKDCFVKDKHNKRDVQCNTCNKEFVVHGYVFEQNNGKCYCSKNCHNLSMRKNQGQNQGRRSPEDLFWKKQVLEKYDNECQNCNSKKRLEAHHIKPIENYPNLRHSIENGICLCHNCHYYGVHNGQPNFKHGLYAKNQQKIKVTLKTELQYLKNELKNNNPT